MGSAGRSILSFKKVSVFVVGIIVGIVVSILLCGCDEFANAYKYEAVCTAYLADIPQEVYQLPPGIRKKVQVDVSIWSATSGKTKSYRLNEKNGFNKNIYLLPGKYEITSVHAFNVSMPMMQVECATKSFEIGARSTVLLPVSISNTAELTGYINNSVPNDEIYNMDPFSRKIQYNGKILSFNDILTGTNISANDAMISSAESISIPSEKYKGISVIMQNQTRGQAGIKDTVFTGLELHYINAALPGGYNVGMDMKNVSHAETGILGTPEYCLGSQYIGAGLDKTTLVYLDYDSGDRISLTIDSSDVYVSSIKYEFAKYE